MLMATIRDDIRPRLARNVRLQIDDVRGKSVLLYPEGIVELNETALEIVARCDGRALGDIVSDLATEYDVDAATIFSDVQETLSDFERRKLIELT